MRVLGDHWLAKNELLEQDDHFVLESGIEAGRGLNGLNCEPRAGETGTVTVQGEASWMYPNMTGDQPNAAVKF